MLYNEEKHSQLKIEIYDIYKYWIMLLAYKVASLDVKFMKNTNTLLM